MLFAPYHLMKLLLRDIYLVEEIEITIFHSYSFYVIFLFKKLFPANNVPPVIKRIVLIGSGLFSLFSTKAMIYMCKYYSNLNGKATGNVKGKVISSAST